MATKDVSPEWGHPLRTPDGRTIRVPQNIFPALKQLGAIQRRQAELTPLIYILLNRKFDALSEVPFVKKDEYSGKRRMAIENIRKILGPDLSGPNTVKCRCKPCEAKKSEGDKTQKPRGPESEAFAEQAIEDMRAARKVADAAAQEQAVERRRKKAS
jgi:hypothetical protein